jgi:hypothetical protein
MGRWQGEHYIADAPQPVATRAGNLVAVSPTFGITPAPDDTAGDASAARALAGGRITVDTQEQYFGAVQVILQPPDAESQWSLLQLDDETLQRLSPAKLLELLSDLSPEVSRGVWDFLRLANPGYEATCLRPGTDEQDTAAQSVLDAFIARLHDLYGTMDVLLGRLFMSAFLRGAFFAELVLDETGRTPVDLATPDPITVRFRRAVDPVRGTVWQPGQWQVGGQPTIASRGAWGWGSAGFIPVDRPTVRYIPVDPFPGSPYGRPLASPAVFCSLFALGLLHDLRRVVAQQGYPRLDLAVNLERLKASMPPTAAADPSVWQAWVNAIISEVKTAYSTLQPDDAFVHTDVVQVNRPVGTVDASSLGAIDPLMKALERMSTRALKSMPLLMGLETTNESAANRQWEVMAAGVKSLQHLCETMLERLMGMALQAQGVVTEVRWRFAELRASELQRDATTLGLQIANARQAWNAGFVSQDEAAQMAVGHEADVPEPRILQRGETVDPLDPADPQSAAAAADTADPGSKRGAPLRVVGEQ